MLLLAALSFALFGAVLAGAMPTASKFSTVILLNVFGISGGFFFNTTTPLFFELTMETIFGWANENAASMILILVNTLFQIAFVAIPTKIGGTIHWPQWLCVAILVVVAGLLWSVPMR